MNSIINISNYHKYNITCSIGFKYSQTRVLLEIKEFKKIILSI